VAWGRKAASGPNDSVDETQGYDAASYQTIAVDGYYAEPVVATFQQVGIFRLPNASVSNQNDGGLLRKDGVGDLSSAPNVYMPQWSAPSRGASYNQTAGAAVPPVNSFVAGNVQANTFGANADASSAIANFLAQKSPRYAGLSVLSGE